MITSLRDICQNMGVKITALVDYSVTEKHASLYSIVLLGLTLFFVWMLAYALIVYEQFSVMQIITVSSLFATILFLFMYFFTDLMRKGFSLSKTNLIYALLLFVLMILLASTFSHIADIYAHTYPLLETEVGLGWHQDTAYHVSHIQSILHFGYPSTGQHGVPLNMYHVLSHYVDALIIWVAQVEPYDSYGLLVTFKVWLLISSIAVFFAAVVKNIHPLLYLLIFTLLAPVLTGSWHAVFSHGLWFTTILVIFSILKVFHIFMERELSNKDCYFIFILLFLVSLGKVSTGLMYASLLCVFLLIKHPTDLRVYVLGILLGGFFVYYSTLFQTVNIDPAALGYDFSILSPSYYWQTILHPTLALEDTFPQNFMIHMSIAILTILAFLFKDRNTIIFLWASIVAYLLLITLTSISLKFGPSDVFYFYLGFTYVLNLFVFMFVVHSLKESKLQYGDKRSCFYVGLWLMITVFVSSTYLSSMPPSSFTKVPVAFKSMNDRPFITINRILTEENQLSVSTLLTGQAENTVFIKFKRPLFNFRKAVNQILVEHRVSKRDALLFVPKEVYEQDISRFGGAAWADGMLLYAITGVPMLYAVKDHTHRGYSQGSYLQKYEWKRSSSFSHILACKNNFGKVIIELVDFDTLTFKIYTCEQGK